MDVKFYKCMHCGNIAVKVFDAGVPLVCCGEKMVELVAGSQDAALEKHVPAVEVEGNKVVVNVGSVDHPMMEEHWIQFICLVTDKGYQIHPLNPGEAPHAEFVIAEGETPLKEMAVVEALARWPEEVVAIGVRHTTVLDRYAAAIREYLPDRPLFVVTGSTVTFAKRRALRDILRDSQNGILLCTQQSLPSSVNFEFVNKIIIPEMHYNNAGMSQFYMRFVRYTSTEKKDLYFPIYIGSLESNLMQMVLAKEKLTMFMKGQDADMDEIYAKFGVDYDLLSTLMTRETDDEGHLRIHWGEQKIA